VASGQVKFEEKSASGEVEMAIGAPMDLDFAIGRSEQQKLVDSVFVPWRNGPKRTDSLQHTSKHRLSQFTVSVAVQNSEPKAAGTKFLQKRAERIYFSRNWSYRDFLDFRHFSPEQ
jgi:hypothetical protein